MLSHLFTPGSSGSGGAGGVSLRWYFGDSNAPFRTTNANGLEVFEFTQSPDELTCYATLKIPNSYTPGVQLFLKTGQFYSDLTSGNVLFRTDTRIFKANISGVSTPTAYTSTNAQQAVDITTNEIVTLSDVDLTDATGQINSVAVAAGDVLLITLYRDTSDETSGAAGSAFMIIDSFEPTFT